MIPEETGGPYPADGTNTHDGSIINVLNQSGVVRSDIRAGFNGATGGGGGRAAQHLTGSATQGYVSALSIAVNG